MNTTVRAATLQDCAAIARVQVNSYRSAYSDLMPAEYQTGFSCADQEQDWADWILGDSELLLVAENDQGAIIGYALSKHSAGEEANYDCEILALHVNQIFHRQGAGRALVAETARRMYAEGCRSLGLWVLEGNPACGFYEHLGGRPNGERFFEIEELRLRRREVGFLWERIEDLFANT
jgi:ribosomal protein S18 acetylase RimI-like enzyme